MLARLLVSLCEQAIRFNDAACRIIFVLCKMTVEQYVEVTTRFTAWGKIALIDGFLIQVLDLLRENALGSKFDTASFFQQVKATQEL
jgi:hypothetical protein